MLAWQLRCGCLEAYDRIYLWDGPYGYLHKLRLFPEEAPRLDQTETGRALLADPRVVYRHAVWADEAEKRRPPTPRWTKRSWCSTTPTSSST